MMPDGHEPEITAISLQATRVFLKIETIAYIVLGLLLALTAMIGILSATGSLWDAVRAFGNADAIVITIDRLLFVLMLVEILHTVRVSFRSGTLVCEPFLVVGLIASIRRVLVITLESSQVKEPGKWSPDTEALLNANLLELGIMGGLILVMVISICFLRLSVRFGKQ
jgi:uncharacterized membrane protein (DUF373 family)